MATFKIKSDKAKHLVQINTLDETHKKIMANFQARKKKLPKLKRKLENLKSELIRLETFTPTREVPDPKKRSDLKTQIEVLEGEIYDIENDISEIDYYCKTEDIIMDYYDIMDKDDDILYDENPELGEAKKEEEISNKTDALDKLNMLNINKRKVKKVTKKRRKRNVANNGVDILKFFNDQNDSFVTLEDKDLNNKNLCEFPEEDGTETECQSESCPNLRKSDGGPIKLSNSDDSALVKNKAQLLDQYMMLVNSDYMCDKKRTGIKIRICSNCGIEKTLNHSEGTIVCQNCGEVEMVNIDSEKPNYKEAVSDTKPGYPYKRINDLFGKASYIVYQGTIHWKIFRILVTFKC